MSWWLWLAAGALFAYLVAIVALIIAGRRTHARALAAFVPDCVVLFHRLLRDPRVPRARKVALALVLAYLVVPIDLVPDFIPIAGQLDDAILVALVLRGLIRGAGEDVVREHWPGPMSIWPWAVRVEGEQPPPGGPS